MDELPQEHCTLNDLMEVIQSPQLRQGIDAFNAALLSKDFLSLCRECGVDPDFSSSDSSETLSFPLQPLQWMSKLHLPNFGRYD